MGSRRPSFNSNRSRMRMTGDIRASKHQANNFAIYATRDGYMNAVNSSLEYVNHTRDIGQNAAGSMLGGGMAGSRLQQSLILARRYHPNPNDTDSRLMA